MSEITITKENFEQEVLKSDKPVLLDFWAEWCGPCKMLSPVIGEIAEEHGGSVKVCKVNVDEQRELSNAFEITGIPTIVYMKNGKVVNTAVGYRPKEELEAMID
ncbi:MAG: thioredoxin [Bacillota bacterium]|nr:thioredoxin [Bacillota bacterium]